jgi:molybdopterin-guanine dinucleotide biosynthesis protein MobB
MKKEFPILHVVGPKNSGKTVLLEWLVHSLTSRGLKVGVLKHSMHNHPVDKPRADSDRMRKAGARPAAFWSEDGLGIYFPSLSTEEGWQTLRQIFADCDLVLVESFGSASNPKIVINGRSENWRDFDNVIALVGSPSALTDLPVFGKQDEKLLSFILDFFKLKKK